MNEIVYNVFGESFKMIFVEGGLCTLGSERECPPGGGSTLHTTVLDDYFIGESLVTERLYSLVVDRDYDKKRSQHPVTIGIKDILYFLFKLNQVTGKLFRLPTIDEWEYAAKGGKKSNGYRYSGSNDINEVAWYEANSFNSTHPIKEKKPNELGLFDMSGNVLEYCSCNIFDSNPNSWNSLYRINRYNFELYRGGCYGANKEECEITYLDDWAQDWYECRGLRLCLSINTNTIQNRIM